MNDLDVAVKIELRKLRLELDAKTQVMKEGWTQIAAAMSTPPAPVMSDDDKERLAKRTADRLLRINLRRELRKRAR